VGPPCEQRPEKVCYCTNAGFLAGQRLPKPYNRRHRVLEILQYRSTARIENEEIFSEIVRQITVLGSDKLSYNFEIGAAEDPAEKCRTACK